MALNDRCAYRFWQGRCIFNLRSVPMLLMMLIMLLPVLLIPLFFVAPLSLALPGYIAGVLVAFIYHRAMMAARGIPVVTGVQGMVGRTAEVVHWEDDHGEVRSRGELWQACRDGSARSVHRGAIVKIVGVRGLTVMIEPVSKPSDPRRSGAA
jgi:membrane protein implicated in regulation of membrane protease activity